MCENTESSMCPTVGDSLHTTVHKKSSRESGSRNDENAGVCNNEKVGCVINTFRKNINSDAKLLMQGNNNSTLTNCRSLTNSLFEDHVDGNCTNKRKFSNDTVLSDYSGEELKLDKITCRNIGTSHSLIMENSTNHVLKDGVHNSSLKHMHEHSSDDDIPLKFSIKKKMNRTRVINEQLSPLNEQRETNWKVLKSSPEASVKERNSIPKNVLVHKSEIRKLKSMNKCNEKSVESDSSDSESNSSRSESTTNSEYSSNTDVYSSFSSTSSDERLLSITVKKKENTNKVSKHTSNIRKSLKRQKQAKVYLRSQKQENSTKSASKRKNTSMDSSDEKCEADSVQMGSFINKNRSNKGKLVAQLLCRWWYVFDDWPPKDYDYHTELEKRKLKWVPLEEWEDANDIDEMGYTKVYQISAFPGVFRDPQGKAIDLRPRELCPSYANFMKKTELELLQDLSVAYKNQIKALDNSPYDETVLKRKLQILLGETNRELIKRQKH